MRDKKNEIERVIFHIDVNSAYLSWCAVDLLKKGSEVDIRDVPSVVGGDDSSRHGIVLAKSIPAKKFNINTGETLYSARKKCKNLIVVPPDYALFAKCSNDLLNLLSEYTPHIQRFSCDECFLDLTNMEHLHGDPIELAYKIKERIRAELGFTVNIGISTNKLLAKCASDFEKPNKVHTLYKGEIEEKLWPLDVGDLFGVGKKTLSKLNSLGIRTVGQLATYDVNILKRRLNSYGEQIWMYANGIESSEVKGVRETKTKGMGHSITTHFDLTSREQAYTTITSLVESLGIRLRKNDLCCSVVSVYYKTDAFFTRRKQRKLSYCTQSTKDLIKEITRLFDELWEYEHIRQIGVHVTDLSSSNQVQLSIFDNDVANQKKVAIDKTLDAIRDKYGKNSVFTAQFINAPVGPYSGGNGEDDYPYMTSLI